MCADALEILSDEQFHRLLLKFDEDLARQVRERGCPDCQGVLHAGHFARKPRGTPLWMDEAYCRRLSFCCAVHGCRHRSTPPSLRFLGPKVYASAVVVLITALRCGVTPTRMRVLRELIGVSRRTVERWRGWWSEVFTETDFWRGSGAQLMPPVATMELPASLLERFAGELRERLVALLRWVLPITGGRRVSHAI